jgi:pimeloyl-ACP methyl ester carboxylesterase
VAEPREHVVNAADGLVLSAMVYGQPTDRRAVVCIPGLTRNARDFVALASDLAADRLVVVVDLRGRGRSGYDATAQSYRVDVYADDVRWVIDDLGVGPAIVIGTSLGGLTAMRLGERAPDRVAGIVLNDIGPEIVPAGLARIASYAGKLPPARSWDEAVLQVRMVSDDALPGLTDAEWIEQTRQRYREQPDGTVVPDHDPLIASGPPATDDPWEVFGALEAIPLLLVRGERTDILAAETADAMAAIHPGMVIATVPDRGHAPTLDEPVARSAIDRFLAEVDGA